MGGSGWGIHVNPWLIHLNVLQNPLQYCKVISLQLIKINEKIKNKLINLAAPDLSCSTWDLVACELSVVAMWDCSHVGSSSLTRHRTKVPGIGSMES